jgi:gamma-butyrobetaine dioxygenase
MSPTEVVDEVFALFRERGNRLYRENLTESQHGLQCATLARFNGEEDAIVAACLLHDFGRLLKTAADECPDSMRHHEEIGANRLSSRFKPEVVEPIRLHVAAMRYLCWKDRRYYESLPTAARQRLSQRGGPMNATEARAFEAEPYHGMAVRLLRYDEMGRAKGLSTPDFEAFRPALEANVDCAKTKSKELVLEVV